jgi:hypothetical protein
MNVKQLIEALEKIEDKEMLVLTEANGYDQEYSPVVTKVEVTKFVADGISDSYVEYYEWSDKNKATFQGVLIG